jgi:hypothetical protein
MVHLFCLGAFVCHNLHYTFRYLLVSIFDFLRHLGFVGLHNLVAPQQFLGSDSTKKNATPRNRHAPKRYGLQSRLLKITLDYI